MEGNIFAYDYATNLSINLDTQIDISFPETNTNEDPMADDAVVATPVVFATGDIVPDDGGEGDGGGDPIPVKDRFVELPTVTRVSLEALPVLMAGECPCSTLQVTDTAHNMAACIVKNGVKNAVGGIIGNGVGALLFTRCRATGPAYFGCLGIGSVAAVVKGLWEQGADVMSRCASPTPSAPSARPTPIPFTRQDW